MLIIFSSYLEFDGGYQPAQNGWKTEEIKFEDIFYHIIRKVVNSNWKLIE
jgi:hypothetical protein